MLLTESSPPEHPILRLTQDRRLFRLVVMIALILGIISASSTKSNGTISATNKSLHIASTIIFLVVTVLQVLQTIILARKDVSGILPCYYQKACQLITIFLTRTKPVLRTRKRLHRSEIRELHSPDNLPVTARS